MALHWMISTQPVNTVRFYHNTFYRRRQDGCSRSINGDDAPFETCKSRIRHRAGLRWRAEEAVDFRAVDLPPTVPSSQHLGLYHLTDVARVRSTFLRCSPKIILPLELTPRRVELPLALVALQDFPSSSRCLLVRLFCAARRRGRAPALQRPSSPRRAPRPSRPSPRQDLALVHLPDAHLRRIGGFFVRVDVPIIDELLDRLRVTRIDAPPTAARLRPLSAVRWRREIGDDLHGPA